MPPPPDSAWAPPQWVKYPRHLPIKDRNKTWRTVVAETGERNGKSRYGPYPEVNEGVIEQLETAVVSEALIDQNRTNELPRPYDHVRAFWRHTGRIIGASCGEETEYIYVEYDQDGSVHGRPMTRRQLIERGMPA